MSKNRETQHPESRRKHDCAIRSISIATGRTYQVVFGEIGHLLNSDGMPGSAFFNHLDQSGWKFHPSHRLPARGRLIVICDGGATVPRRRHAVAVINGTFYDTAPPAHGACVHGYFAKKERPDNRT